ncbi:MAG TPA: ArgE/DapE family deacylase [Candidatus Methylomirabilis sp.]|nr:ArgE/DapE family deacylase [Candidatus Methylomirabilis sp.]
MELRETLAKHLDRDGLVQMLRTLVSIPSLTGEEDSAQAEMIRMLRELKGEVDAWRVDVRALQDQAHFPGGRILTPRLNVVATFAGTGAGPTLVLNGHMDTVTAGDEGRWTHPPFRGDVLDDKLYGRGATDMKGGLAAILGALGAIQEAGIRLRGSVCVQSVIGEEDGGLGTFAALTRGHRGDAVIVCEPTRLEVVPAHAGVTLFRITVAGRSAHGAVRAEGVSAFQKFLAVHEALLALESHRNNTLRHPLYEGNPLPWPLSIGMVTAGTWPAIVPETLTAEGRIGVAIGERIPDVRRQVEDAVRRAADQDPWLSEHPPRVEWIGGSWEPTETPRDHPLVRTLCDAVAAVTARPAPVRGATYGSDLRLFTNSFGMPGTHFGPGDIRQAHFTDEYVAIPEVEIAALALAITIVRFCGSS